MAVPPERITVKRRRDDDPIEALFIQSKKYRPSAVWKLAEDAGRIPTYADYEISSETLKDPRQAFLTSKVSKSGISPSRADLPEQTGDTTSDFNVSLPAAETSTSHVITRPAKGGQELILESRRFHLTKRSFQASSPYTNIKSPAEKHRNQRKNELAVFMEAGKVSKTRSARRNQTNIKEAPAQPEKDEEEQSEASVPVQKRANATAVERKWRAENWEKPKEIRASLIQGSKQASDRSQPSSEWDYESPELAAQLQQIAFEEIKTQQERSKDLGARQQLKVQPKPPKPRRIADPRDRYDAEEDHVMADGPDLNDDTDYIFDTYVRSNTAPLGTMESTDPLIDPLQKFDPSKMGVLIIEDGEEEELWETFGEDADSDVDFNSDQEDENAEDFHGNDYPEDEVDSDDEFGRGAYNNRQGASDDEEFSEEDPDWSDDERVTKAPWALSR